MGFKRFSKEVGETYCSYDGYSDCRCRECGKLIEENDFCGIDTRGTCDCGIYCFNCAAKRRPDLAAKATFGLDIKIDQDSDKNIWLELFANNKKMSEWKLTHDGEIKRY